MSRYCRFDGLFACSPKRQSVCYYRDREHERGESHAGEREKTRKEDEDSLVFILLLPSSLRVA